MQRMMNDVDDVDSSCRYELQNECLVINATTRTGTARAMSSTIIDLLGSVSSTVLNRKGIGEMRWNDWSESE